MTAARAGDYEIAVIGAGPAGLAAVVTARSHGAAVAVIDEGARPGGQIWRHRETAQLPSSARSWVARFDESDATRLMSTSVVSVTRTSDGRFDLQLDGPSAPTSLRARAIVLATGARELFLPFPGWTLPGVVGVGGIQALAKSGTSFRGKRVAIAGSGPLIMPVAAYLASHGAKLSIVAEQADRRAVFGFAAGLVAMPSLLVSAARYRAAFATTRYRTGVWVTRAEGDDRVRSATFTDGDRSWTIDCDWLAVGFGLVPNLELARHLGCEITGGAVRVDRGQRTSVAGVYAAGESAGVAGVDVAVAEGTIAALAHLSRLHDSEPSLRARERGRAYGFRMERAFAPRPELRRLAAADTIVCRCEDVSLGEVDSQWSARQAKLYRRVGMGPCQGRVCGAALQFLRGWERDTVRIPLQPSLVSTLVVAPTAAGVSSGANDEHTSSGAS